MAQIHKDRPEAPIYLLMVLPVEPLKFSYLESDHNIEAGGPGGWSSEVKEPPGPAFPYFLNDPAFTQSTK